MRIHTLRSRTMSGSMSKISTFCGDKKRKSRRELMNKPDKPQYKQVIVMALSTDYGKSLD